MKTRSNPSFHLLCSLSILGGALLFAGCGKSEPARFHLNMVNLANQDLSEQETQKDIATALAAVFGTPDHPIAPPDSGLNQTELDMAAGPVWSDEAGGKHGLYREHCAHCHGITGDGNGPTALFLNPYPRDFREGKFKAKSTQRVAKPTDEDLRRVIRNGIHGTAMPAFKLLPPDEIDALVQYVKYLSMRGELEKRLTQFFADEGLEEPEEGEPAPRLTDPENMRSIVLEDVDFGLPAVVAPWEEAKDNIILPNPEFQPKAWDDRDESEKAESVAIGRKLFFGSRAACSTCHGNTAVGDGTIDGYDDWNLPVSELAYAIKNTDLEDYDSEAPKPEDLEEGDDPRSEREQAIERLATQEHALATALPPRFIRPRNLRKGVYRFGDRPIDIYWRIREGINGTPMPAAALVTEGSAPAEPSGAEAEAGGEAEGGEPTTASLTEAEIWNLVDYVRFGLPYEATSQLPAEPVENLRERN